MLYPKHAALWVFAAPSGHVTKLAEVSFAGHDLRRSYSSAAGDAGVFEEVVERLLNHRAESLAGRTYMQSAAMLRSLLATQETISRHIIELFKTQTPGLT
jgi:hypothetical protein